jgi:penicillin-binding protein 2
MNEISGPELEELRKYGYHRGDYVGRAGLERSFEAVLRGAPGLRRQVIDVNGNAQNLEVAQQLLGAYREMAPVPGKSLRLTIDMELQEIIDEAVS